MFDIQTLFDGTSLVSGGRKHDFTAPPYHIVVVGSSGSGKTTLVNFIRNSELTNQIDIPLRYVTRPQRENDDLGENRPVTHNEFEKLASEGIIAVQWQRDLGGDKKEKYGFVKLTKGQMGLYSANNAIVKPDAGLQPLGFLENSLIIGVYASDDARASRLHDRSPDIIKKKNEARIRLAGDDIFPYADIIVDNNNSKDKMGQDFKTVLHKLVCLHS